MKARVENIVKTLHGKISMIQALYEAIANSLEANAENINVYFNQFPTSIDTICYDSFEVVDDGDGFNENNCNSFLEYLSDFKRIQYGCKGVGRFIWLKVFNSVLIVSKIKNKKVTINFDLQFDDDNSHIQIENIESDINETSITFLGNKLDQRDYIFDSIKKIKTDLLNTFEIKLFLVNKAKKIFCINLIDRQSGGNATIENDDLLSLTKHTFNVSNSCYTSEFTMYYNFFADSKALHKIVLCADNRGIKDINLTTKSKIISDLPNNDSYICLIISKYLNDCVNSSRTDFDLNVDDEKIGGLSRTEIYNQIKTEIEKIMLSQYPTIVEQNRISKEHCIEKAPYLKTYIMEDSSIIVNEEKVISEANKKYEKAKENAQINFSKLCEKRGVDSKGLIEGINEINDFSAKELSKYFLYRQSIINCLGEYIKNNEQKEKLLHDLFIPQGEILNGSVEDRLNNNIWLLDDKFMSSYHLFSDKSVERVIKEIKDADAEEGEDDLVKPDLTILYSNNSAIVVEFKAIGTNYNKKIDAITEIDRNNAIIAKNLDSINSLYGFIITEFDDKFIKRVSGQHGIKKMYSNDLHPIFYYYNENVLNKENISIPCHTYILSTSTIYNDANARNKLFIDIIKNQR